jgi:tetratricopeptide (TPR) repeat protein
VAYTGVALARVEPYPLDYFNELVGGPSGVAARKMFEIPWWGEGNLAAIRALNRVATHGARVHLALWPPHALLRLRDDLVAVDDPATADYVLVSHLQYFARPPAACVEIGSVAVEGAPLVDSYHCTPVSPTQLGFAAMTRGAPDEALPRFRDALARDPRDPAALFGMGWASQVKGNLAEATSFYAEAAPRAAETGDLDTEYFARFDLGTLYAQQGKHDDAASSFRATLAVVDRAPDRFADRAWSPWLNLGLALSATGQVDDARAALERARSLRPDEPAIADALKSLPAAPEVPPVRSSDPPAAPPRR